MGRMWQHGESGLLTVVRIRYIGWSVTSSKGSEQGVATEALATVSPEQRKRPSANELGHQVQLGEDAVGD
jgi:hypothetical protein